MPVTWGALWDAALDLGVGASCVGCRNPGRLLCATCADALPLRSVAARPTPCPPGLAPARAAGPYDGCLRAMVLAHKEHRALALARPLGDLLALAVADLLAPGAARTLLVPVPSRRAVVSARGHDPLLRMVRRAAVTSRRRFGAQVTVASLLRQRVRPADQAGLGAAARLANLDGTMALDARVVHRLAGTARSYRVLVCDDVLTTGATVREAQRALESGGIAVHGIACVAATVRRLPLSTTSH